MTKANEIETAKVKQFSARIMEDYGNTLRGAMLYIGDRLGLFKALAHGQWVTLEELAQQTGYTTRYLREWLGDPAKLGAVSPVNLAERIKVPVFLAAGGEDKRAPIQHTERMEAALKRAGTPVESLYYKTEGHGFYTEAHRSEYYDKLLAFLARSLGGKTATTAPVAGKDKAP